MELQSLKSVWRDRWPIAGRPVDSPARAGRLGLLLGLLAVLAGCASNDTGRTVVPTDYGWGALKAQLDYPVSTTYAALTKTLVELGVNVLRDHHDNISAEIVASDAEDQTLTIELGALPEDRTEMTIRVGTLGDKSKSTVIFNRVMGNLRTGD